LNTIHSEKVRSLMNSIALLKKEAMSLKKASKEHKRSELITSLNKEISDQDLIIETLRTLVPNGDTADKEIIRVLTKGPPKIRIETREELKMEIKKLKSQLIKFTNKKEENVNNENNIKSMNIYNDEMRNSVDSQSSIKTDFNENFFQQIDLFKKENEDLRLNLKAQHVIIQKYEEENNEKLQELNELRLIKTDFNVLTKKYETLQKENDKIKENNNKKFVMTYDKEMRLEELEILNKTQQGKLTIVEKNAGYEMNNFKQQFEDLDLKNNELQTDNDKISIRYNELLQKNKGLNEVIKKNKEEFEAFKKEKELIDKRNETMLANLRQSLIKMEEERNVFENDNTTLSNGIFLIKSDLNKLKDENQELRMQNLELKENIKDVIKGNDMEQPLETNKVFSEDILSIPMKNINAKQPPDNKNNEIFNENKLLKKKIKDFTIQQIELMEKIDGLELELKLRGKKESNAFIKTKQNERQTQKIQDMQKKLRDIELKNKSTFQRLDSNLSQNSKNLDKEKFSKIDLDSNLSYSLTFSKMNSKISTPLKSESLIETNSDITTENKELKKVLKEKQEEDLNLKIRFDGLERESKGKLQKDAKKDGGLMENERKIKDLAEKISNLSFNNSDISRQGSVLNSSILDSNVSNLDSNIESIMSYQNKNEKIETDSNISIYKKK